MWRRPATDWQPVTILGVRSGPNLMQKLNLHSTVAIVLYAVRNGLLVAAGGLSEQDRWEAYAMSAASPDADITCECRLQMSSIAVS